MESVKFAIYLYAWKNNSKRASLSGRKCRVVYRGRPNSALVEFENGQREIISRNAIRRLDTSSALEGTREAKHGG